MLPQEIGDQYQLCMVRRMTARLSLGERQVCGNVFGLWWSRVLLARMSSAARLSLQVGRSLRTIIGIRLRARRFDCSFVLTVPMQTLVGKVVEVVERESGSAKRFQAAGVFSALSHAAAAMTPGR